MNREVEQNDKLVVLATFATAIEAHALRVALEAEGITARIGNEQSAPLMGASIFGPTSAFWIEVLVMKSDSEKALDVKYRCDIKNESTIPEWICECGETVDEGFAVCWSCSNEYVTPPEQ